MIEKTTFSPEGTMEFGRALAQELKAGSVVALIGPLGSGKTVLIQGICSGLGVTEFVTSPSFVIINEYPGKIKVYHFDLYRLENIEEFIKLGYEEYFYGNGITLIEWAEKIKTFLPEERIEINLEIVSEKERRISVRRLEGLKV
jgi:tRNA threonylcarbamoyladenosine biosynthesis protein TsaE